MSTVLSFAVALIALRATATAADSLPSEVDSVAAEFMAKQQVPGVAIAVMRHGEIVYEHGYGYADVGNRAPVTVDTRFEIGSITKQFTAACIMQQVRAGKLSLDDTLDTFVTGYPAAAKVTVRQMLSHTSGIPEYAFFGQAIPTTVAAIVARVAKKPLNFAPGSRWSYSNTNYVLLGKILESTAGEPYEQYVREHIFGPAMMAQSGFVSEEHTLPDMAIGYQKSGAIGAQLEMRDAAGADGSIISTVGDVAKWDRALASGAIVPLDDVKLMQTPVRLTNGSSAKYGFGWAVDTYGGHPRISHNGGTNGFTATNALFPNDDESIVVLENLAEGSPARVSAAVFSAEHPDVTAAFNTALPGENVTVTARLREILRRYAIGRPDRTQFSARFIKELFNPDAVAFAQGEFMPLGPATRLVFRGKAEQPAQPAQPARSIPATTVYRYNVAFGSDQESVVIGIDRQNKVGSFGFSRYTDSDTSAKRNTITKEDTDVTARVRDWMRRLATGDIDRSQLADSFSSFFNPAMAARSKRDLAPLGPAKAFVFRGGSEHDGKALYTYDVGYASARMRIIVGFDAQEKIGVFAYGPLR